MEQRKGKRFTKKKTRRVVFLLLFLLVLMWIYYGNTSIQVNEIQIESTRIPKEFDGYRIAHIADLHNAEFGKEQSKLLLKLHEANPDLIVITGDLIDSKTPNVTVAMDFVKAAVKIAPVYYVTGNHEAWTHKYSELKKELIKSKVKILDDDKEELRKGNSAILLLGLKDPAFYHLDPVEEGAMLSSKLMELKKDAQDFSLLLSHRPEHFESYVESGIDLVLSGHAHGGQFRIPFIGGVIAPNQGFFPKYTAGLYQDKNTAMVVSRGLGNSIIPVRINNPPEIVMVILKAGKKEAR